MKRIIDCEVCGKRVIATTGSQKFCENHSIWRRYQGASYVPKKRMIFCQVCGKRVIPTGQNQKYCSACAYPADYAHRHRAQRAQWRKAKRKADSEFRARDRATQRAWYVRNRERVADDASERYALKTLTANEIAEAVLVRLGVPPDQQESEDD